MTRGEHGAIAIADGVRTSVTAEPVAAVVDTTGAGDLFAAGFLSGHVRGADIQTSLITGAVCAGLIIAQIGPRAQSDIGAAVALRLAE